MLREMPGCTVQERIVAAARQLREEGADGRLAVERVAQRAGVSRATVYRYFPDRAALLNAASDGQPGPGDARSQILDAALQVFSERGLHAATLAEIARRAGLSLSGLHWHFRNKAEIVAGLAEHMQLLPALRVEAALAGRRDLESQLTHVGAMYLTVFRERSGLIRLALSEAAIHPDVATLVSQQLIGRALPVLVQLFEEHARRGGIRSGPYRLWAQAFISMLVVRVLASPFLSPFMPTDDDECVREYARIVVRGLVTHASGADA